MYVCIYVCALHEACKGGEWGTLKLRSLTLRAAQEGKCSETC